MGAACTRNAPPQERLSPHVPVPVTLHVYDVGTSGGGSIINRVLRPLGTGAFHCGVEVYGWEWSYSDIANPAFKDNTGVFSCKPRNCEGHSYNESVPMGKTSTSEGEVLKLIQWLEKEWPVAAYDVLHHNCCHFSNELCQRLGVGSIPSWVTNLAGVGAAIASTGEVADTTCCRMVAFQVADTMCCREGRKHKDGHEEYVEAIPVLSQQEAAYDFVEEGVASEGDRSRRPKARSVPIWGD